MDELDVQLREITAQTVVKVCALSETLPLSQQRLVADNAISIAQGHFSSRAWMRAIYAGDTPVGFMMLHMGPEEGFSLPDVFLWRLMIAAPEQGKGYGRRAMELLFDHLRAQGVPKLVTTYVPGEGSPEGFYKKLGFVPTGKKHEEEIELVFKLV